MNKQKIAASVLIALGTIGFAFWRWEVGGSAHPAHCALVWDASESMAIGSDSVVSAARHAFASPCLGKGSMLTVIGTGDASSADEPIAVASYEVPVNRRVLEGRGGALDRREEMLNDLKKKCDAVPRTKSSPIYLAFKRAVEQLQAEGCKANSNCFLLAQTDLEENVNAQIKEALDGRTGASGSLPAPINNDGINVVISGIAETVGVAKSSDGLIRHFTNNRDQQRADRIVEVWRKLFTSADRVSFRPYSPKA